MDPSTLPVDIFVTSLQFTKNTYQDIYPAIDPTLPSLSLAGKVVIVTGASRGIGGHGIVPAIAKAGAKALVLVGTNHDMLIANEAKVREINPAIKTLSVATEISDPKAVANLFAQVASTFGHADVLVHSAAIGVGNGKFHDEEPATWWKNFVSPSPPQSTLSLTRVLTAPQEVNIMGTFNLAQSFIKSLPSSTTPATFINLTTGGAWGIYPYMLSGYNISKLGALQLGSWVAAVYPNITVINLHPGLVETDMHDPNFARFNKDTPELVGGTVVWLASEKAKFLTGRTICANWSVDDLVERKDEIVAGNLLTIGLTGKFGKDQFEYMSR
jgi:NAD(P)-dependent dehydrogenase (short-subunit alcohol dehydrogenase family)